MWVFVLFFGFVIIHDSNLVVSSSHAHLKRGQNKHNHGKTQPW